jgi:hypothetical protein
MVRVVLLHAHLKLLKMEIPSESALAGAIHGRRDLFLLGGCRALS